jgi:arabinose-5-phosphate isomerase
MIDQVFDRAITALIDAKYGIDRGAYRKVLSELSTRFVWVTGVGKSGISARKVSATLASNHARAAYLSASDAVNGGLGAVSASDAVLVFSNSGSNPVLEKVMVYANSLGACVILVTGNANGNLCPLARVVVCYGQVSEACPLGLTPGASSLVQCAIGDSLALDLQDMKKLTKQGYMSSHPG